LTMNIRFLGTHNTLSRDSRYTCFLIDGVLGVDAGSIAASLSFAEQRNIEAVLLSHGHYDHIRELPALAFNNVLSGKAIGIYGTKETLDLYSGRFSDGKIYPDFIHGTAHFEKPVHQLHEVHALEPFAAGKYHVLPVKMPHAPSSVGYEITKDGKRLFYTGDTGPGLAEVWQNIAPDLLITELTVPDRLLEFARESHHLCPGLLREELEEFRRQKGYVPRVLAAHRNPEFEPEIAKEIKQVFLDRAVGITLAVPDKTYTI
jgi:Cft2 family RNA processing exonuclease